MSKPRVRTSKEVLAHIDTSKPVHVYRNLHKDCLSVRQLGRVLCHTDNIVLANATFVVNEAGREKVRREKKKNVHAYVKGTVIDAADAWKGWLPFEWDEVYYNPYKCDFFKSGDDYIDGARFVDIEGQPCDISPGILAFDLTFRR